MMIKIWSRLRLHRAKILLILFGNLQRPESFDWTSRRSKRNGMPLRKGGGWTQHRGAPSKHFLRHFT
eukprot:7016918-Karenia_brevis.AAC.1